MTPDDLAAFRAALPGCELAMLADTAARTVLISDGDLRLGQARLDALCADAVALRATAGDLPLARAVRAGPVGLQLFLPSPSDPAEVLCALFAPGTDVTEARFPVNEGLP